MIRLRDRLALFNVLSKILFAAVFIAVLPLIVQRINFYQSDKELVGKREKLIEMISRIGIDPFISADSVNSFGSYDILKDEFINIEMITGDEEYNYIEVSDRNIEDEIISYRVINYSIAVDGRYYLLEIGKSMESILVAEKNIKKIIWIFTLLIILITLAADLYYTRKVLLPLDIITKKLKNTSSPELFDKSPVKTTTIDFFNLDQSLTELMNRIDELFRKERDITNNISHELMTPLSILRSKLENLMARKDIDNSAIEKIEESLRTLHRLKSLVNALLLVSRIENRQFLKEESFSVKNILEEVINEIAPVAEDTSISISTEFKDDIVFKNANRNLIFSMFYNVLNNAVQNTPSKGRVLVNGRTSGNKFRVDIADTGKGMTDDELRTMFSRFRVKAYRENSGNGIGLVITKTIADFHDIDISAKSMVNEGSTFSFIFTVEK